MEEKHSFMYVVFVIIVAGFLGGRGGKGDAETKRNRHITGSYKKLC